MDYRESGNIDPADFPNLKHDCVLFYHPSCMHLAEKIAGSAKDINLGQIDWGCDVKPYAAHDAAASQSSLGRLLCDFQPAQHICQ
jgi:hypothetical protein